MKKLILTVLCLFLTGCGTFNLKVQVFPPSTEVALFVATVSPQPVLPPTPFLTELPATAVALPTVNVTPTSSTRTVQAIMLRTIRMNDTQNGWGVTSMGLIVATADGGGMWKDVTPSDEKYDLHGLFAFNRAMAWAAPAQLDPSHVVWRTLDGGKTWKASQPIPLGEGKYSTIGLQFPDARHGWLLLLAQNSDQENKVVLYKSDNAGVDWSPVEPLNASAAQYYLPATQTTMAFFDGKSGWLGGWWGKDDPGQWLMLKTVDGGVNWGTDSLRLPAQKNVQCKGQSIVGAASDAMLVDVTCTKSNDAKYLYHHIYYLSTNTGPDWRSWASAGDFLGAYFLNTSQGWMMATSDDPLVNEIRYTKDGGKSWDKISKVAWKQAQFDFVTDRLGWALSDNGFITALFRTENGGKVWIQVRPYMEP